MIIDLIISLRYRLSQNFKNENPKKVKEIYFLLDKLEKDIKDLMKY